MKGSDAIRSAGAKEERQAVRGRHLVQHFRRHELQGRPLFQSQEPAELIVLVPQGGKALCQQGD